MGDVENEKAESVDASSEGVAASSEAKEVDPSMSQSVEVAESIEEPVEKSVEPAEEVFEEPFKDHSDEPEEPSHESSNGPSACAKCDCENSLEHIVLSAKFTRGSEATAKDSLPEPETPVPPSVESLPATLPEETAEWMREAAKLGEEVRKRGPSQVPFVPIYVPVVVPVVRKESEEKVSKKSVCPQVFASLVSLATVLLYYYMILWRHWFVCWETGG